LRSQYVDAAARLPGDLPVSFLKEQLEQGNGRDSQIAAAKGLQSRAKADEVTAMIGVWHTLQQRIAQGEMDPAWRMRWIPGMSDEPPEEDMNIRFQVDEVAILLANSGTAPGIETLRESMPKLPVNVRMTVVEKFVPPDPYVADTDKSADGDAEKAIERLLTEALTDTGGGSASFGKEGFKDARICDIAALALAKRWPEKYRFTWTDSEADRERQVAPIRSNTRGH